MKPVTVSDSQRCHNNLISHCPVYIIIIITTITTIIIVVLLQNGKLHLNNINNCLCSHCSNCNDLYEQQIKKIIKT